MPSQAKHSFYETCNLPNHTHACNFYSQPSINFPWFLVLIEYTIKSLYELQCENLNIKKMTLFPHPPRPTPSIKWLKKGGELSAERVHLDSFNKTLRITSVSEEDAGEYVCMASNLIGSISHSIHVQVKGQDTGVTLQGAARGLFSYCWCPVVTDCAKLCPGQRSRVRGRKRGRLRLLDFVFYLFVCQWGFRICIFIQFA